jgi:hypothetical protein
MNKAKLFITHHPNNLFLYKNLFQIIRKYDKDTKILLFKVNHPNFSKFNFEPYKEYFDKIIEFDFIHYQKNFLKGIFEALVFQRKLKKVISDFLRNFQEIDLFLDNSAWLPVNILLYNLSQEKNIKNIHKITVADPESPQTKGDKIKTLLCALYSLPFRCYKVKAISTLEGKFVDFVYDCNTPGDFLKIVSPIVFDKHRSLKEDILPYPVFYQRRSAEKRDMVIIFGDANIYQDFREYLPSYEIFIEKLNNFFKAIENKYSNCQLYYKPHPNDKEGEIMPGMNLQKYHLFDNTANAQMLFEKYQKRIKAIYTFSSSSAIFGSFFGIPSYTFYRYLFNPLGIEKFNSFFNQVYLMSKFLFHIADLSEIGKIDDLKPSMINLKNLEKRYRKVFNI